jgi:hypothetical protein
MGNILAVIQLPAEYRPDADSPIFVMVYGTFRMDLQMQHEDNRPILGPIRDRVSKHHHCLVRMVPELTLCPLGTLRQRDHAESCEIHIYIEK